MKKLVKKLSAKLRSIITRPRVIHYVDIFLAGTGVALYYNRDHILGAHGLDALGCIAVGACVAGLKAVIEAYRKSVPTSTPGEPPAA